MEGQELKAKFYSYDESFAEYISYTENDIIEVTSKGISLKDGTFIDFRICADNFENAHKGSGGKCVAERMAPVFIFYTSPKPTKLTFLYKNKIREFFSPTRNRVNDLQKKLNQFGFRTYDMS